MGNTLQTVSSIFSNVFMGPAGHFLNTPAVSLLLQPYNLKRIFFPADNFWSSSLNFFPGAYVHVRFLGLESLLLEQCQKVVETRHRVSNIGL